MVSLFGKKKKPEEELPPMETYPAEEQGIREQVGYPPEEGYEEPPEGIETEPSPEAPQYEYPQEGGPFAEAEVPPGEYPEFLPQAGAPEAPPMEGGVYTTEDVEKIAREVADEVRKEFGEKLKNLNDELDELRKMEHEIEKMYTTFEKLNEKYADLEDEISELPTKNQKDLDEIKATINSMNQIMSSALPALIKEVRDLKPPPK
ncbi:TPA: hypothetical protein H1005_00660 [archaeon]|uniref:Uncharacterized protein n=1 Tax=Candidatus Naiadarchaeum limnaeum TaxID=2756139 RepID=A0A832V5N7_9ARCH|nr:hypothetical protein [Candidatus Naiadarchaeales archaeon SRR2090153.bin1042]HIK00720.1 hypothetical protein [Candidatus Naiadarchaeum limnaeum]